MSPKAIQAGYTNKREASSISFSLKWIKWLGLILICSTILFFLKSYLTNPLVLPISNIQVYGEEVNVEKEMVINAATKVVEGGFFTVDVDQIRGEVEKLSWIYAASVRRVWPNTIKINVTEEKAVAVLNKVKLLNFSGDVFKAEDAKLNNTLPTFEGDASLNKLMLKKYYAMNKVLEEKQLKIMYLNIDGRRATELRLSNGLKVYLGRNKNMPRLERFMRIYSNNIEKYIDDIETVDLRYTNGLAISWKIKMDNNKKSIGDIKHV